MPEQNHSGSGDNVAGNQTNIHQQGNFGVGVNQGEIHIHTDRSSPVPKLKGIPHNIPITSSKEKSEFLGRDEELKELHQKLQSTETKPVVIGGMVGVGKTELALQYAKDHLQTYSGGICWLSVRDSDVVNEIVEFARLELDLKPERLTNLSKEAQVNCCWSYWRDIKGEKNKFLLVLDDVTDYREIKDCLPNKPCFKVLITTEKKEIWSPSVQLELDVLTQTVALKFLKFLVRDNRVDEQSKDAIKICRWLGNLPLGLELVGRYLAMENNLDLSLAEMFQRLYKRGLKEDGPLVKVQSEMTTKYNITAVLHLSWKELRPEGKQLAYLLSLFALAPIPWLLVENVINNLASDWEKRVENDRGDLLNRSLLKRTGKETYQLHSVIRQFLRDKLEEYPGKEDMKRGFCQAMVTVVASEIPQKPTRKDIEDLAPTIPHLEETATALTKYLSDKDLIRPFIGLGRFYEGKSLYFQAEEWYQKGLSTIPKPLEERLPSVCRPVVALLDLDYVVKLHTVKIQNALAFLYFLQQRYDKAQGLYIEALKTGEKLGKKALDVVAQTKDGLGYLYTSSGEYEKAKPLLDSALEIRKQALEKFGKQASKIEKDLWEKHLDKIRTLSRLGFWFREKGEFDDAERHYCKALEIAEKYPIEKNKSITLAETYNNLATNYRARGDESKYREKNNEKAKTYYEQAEKLYLEALNIYEHELPKGNKSLPVAILLRNLAQVYDELGKDNVAQILYCYVIDIRKSLLGEHHLHVVESLVDLATFFRKRKLYSKAESSYLESLKLIKELKRTDR